MDLSLNCCFHFLGVLTVFHFFDDQKVCFKDKQYSITLVVSITGLLNEMTERLLRPTAFDPLPE